MVVESIANIILSVSFISSFIGAFFFTYGNIVEKNVIVDQSKFVATELSRDLNLLPNTAINNIKKSLKVPDLSQQDAEAAKLNSFLESEAAVILSIVFVTGLLLSWGLCLWKKISFFETVKKNLVILVFIGITEFIFLTFFAQNVIIADPTFVRVKVLKTIKGQLPEPSAELPQIPTGLPISIPL